MNHFSDQEYENVAAAILQKLAAKNISGHITNHFIFVSYGGSPQEFYKILGIVETTGFSEKLYKIGTLLLRIRFTMQHVELIPYNSIDSLSSIAIKRLAKIINGNLPFTLAVAQYYSITCNSSDADWENFCKQRAQELDGWRAWCKKHGIYEKIAVIKLQSDSFNILCFINSHRFNLV